MNKFIFSVVVPVYNVENYLRETLDSVINQTIGLDKIEIILVNDGSKDNSKDICMEYVQKYPNNIIYVEQENSGVSEARNNGLNHARGKYVNFLDSDDCWEEDVFEKVLNMFEENADLDVIGVRQKLFEAQEGYTSLDYKFEKNPDGVYDIRKYPSYIQLSVTSGFFRIEAAKTAKFDKRIKYSEDAKYIYDVFINRKKTKLGLISSSCHLYRKRFSQNSAINTKDTKKDWYIQTVKLSYKYIYDRCKKEFPEIIKTIENYIIYDYQFRYKMNLDEVENFSEEEKKDYIKDTTELISNIDDEFILSIKYVTVLARIHLLKIKYKSDVKALKVKLDYGDKFPVFVNFNSIDIKNNKMYCNAVVDLLYSEKLKLYYVLNGKKHYINFRRDADLFSYNNLFNERVNKCEFDLEIDLDKKNDLSFYAEVDNKSYKLKLAYYKHLNIVKYKCSYKQINNYILTLKPKGMFLDRKSCLVPELKMILMLLRNKKIKTTCQRLWYRITKLFKRKEIWLISDRLDVAGDNAEALFNYICKVKPKNIEYYFVLSKNSKDLDRIKKVGPVLIHNSFKFTNKFLLADKVISSQFDEYVLYPTSVNRYLKGLTNYEFVFLQHGVTNNDMTSIINKFNFLPSLFVTCSKVEKDLIVKDKRYGYDEKIVKAIGFPRYDKLQVTKNKENVLLLSPTWRANLSADPTGQYFDGFKETKFYKFYNQLFTDERLQKVLKDKKYKIKFCLHYRIRNQIKDFDKCDNIEFIINPNYSKEITDAKALITDYSSLAFDFAYLNKPVVYNRFDRDTFYKNHLYRPISGDKFILGEVSYNYEDFLSSIIKLIENDCKNPKKYSDKARKFFKYHDKNNSKRVYEEILKLK